MNRKGFTLLELSIVLVIISLIIGGIIQGQQIIENSKIARITSEVNEIKAAFNNFKIKYNAIPGDMDNASSIWATAENGDGNGSVVKYYDDYGEELLFWRHMSLAGVYPGNYKGSYPDDGSGYINIGIQQPGSKFRGNATYSYYNPSDVPDLGLSVFTKSGNVLELGGCPAISVWSTKFRFCSNGIMSGQQAENLDKKMDDGVASTGYMMGVNGLTSLATNTAGCSANYTSSSASYTVNSQIEACRLFFWIEQPDN